MNHAAHIEQIERDLRRLQIDINRYLAGALDLPPENFRKELGERIRHLRGQQVKNVSDRFRLNAVTDRFNLLCEHFNRRLRELETGTGHRATTDERAHDPRQGVVLDAKPAPAAVRALYDALYPDHQRASPFPAFREYLLGQLDAIRARTGCDRVRFRVELQEGKPRLKARALEGRP